MAENEKNGSIEAGKTEGIHINTHALEVAKDSWEELALEDPAEARRQLRTFWAIACAAAGIVGLFVGFML